MVRHMRGKLWLKCCESYRLIQPDSIGITTGLVETARAIVGSIRRQEVRSVSSNTVDNWLHQPHHLRVFLSPVRRPASVGVTSFDMVKMGHDSKLEIRGIVQLLDLQLPLG